VDRGRIARPTGALFNKYARAVYSLGFRLTADRSAGREVVSLTFLDG
jgi:hypothetical protein